MSCVPTSTLPPQARESQHDARRDRRSAHARWWLDESSTGAMGRSVATAEGLESQARSPVHLPQLRGGVMSGERTAVPVWHPTGEFTPTQRRIVDCIIGCEGRWITAQRIRDDLFPALPINNIYVHVSRAIARGAPIEADERRTSASRGYRWLSAACPPLHPTTTGSQSPKTGNDRNRKHSDNIGKYRHSTSPLHPVTATVAEAGRVASLPGGGLA